LLLGRRPDVALRRQLEIGRFRAADRTDEKTPSHGVGVFVLRVRREVAVRHLHAGPAVAQFAGRFARQFGVLTSAARIGMD
jgi:hypothetical protein